MFGSHDPTLNRRRREAQKMRGQARQVNQPAQQHGMAPKPIERRTAPTVITPPVQAPPAPAPGHYTTGPQAAATTGGGPVKQQGGAAAAQTPVQAQAGPPLTAMAQQPQRPPSAGAPAGGYLGQGAAELNTGMHIRDTLDGPGRDVSIVGNPGGHPNLGGNPMSPVAPPDKNNPGVGGYRPPGAPEPDPFAVNTPVYDPDAAAATEGPKTVQDIIDMLLNWDAVDNQAEKDFLAEQMQLQNGQAIADQRARFGAAGLGGAAALGAIEGDIRRQGALSLTEQSFDLDRMSRDEELERLMAGLGASFNQQGIDLKIDNQDALLELLNDEGDPFADGDGEGQGGSDSGGADPISAAADDLGDDVFGDAAIQTFDEAPPGAVPVDLYTYDYNGNEYQYYNYQGRRIQVPTGEKKEDDGFAQTALHNFLANNGLNSGRS